MKFCNLAKAIEDRARIIFQPGDSTGVHSVGRLLDPSLTHVQCEGTCQGLPAIYDWTTEGGGGVVIIVALCEICSFENPDDVFDLDNVVALSYEDLVISTSWNQTPKGAVK